MELGGLRVELIAPGVVSLVAIVLGALSADLRTATTRGERVARIGFAAALFLAGAVGVATLYGQVRGGR